MERIKIVVITDLNFPSDDFQAVSLLSLIPNIDVVGIVAENGNTWSHESLFNIFATIAMMPFRNQDEIAIAVNKDPIPNINRRRAIQAVACGFRSFIGAFGKSHRPRLRNGAMRSANSSIDGKELICELADKYAGRLRVVSLAPMMALANAIRFDRRIAQKIASIHAMCGHFPHTYHDTSRTDFNVWFDPSSAKTVFDSGIPMSVFPLSTCRQTRMDSDTLVNLASYKGKAEIILKDLVGMMRQHGSDLPLIDHLPVLSLFNQRIVKSYEVGEITVRRKPLRVRGETHFRPCKSGNIKLVKDVSRDEAYGSVVELFERSHRRCNTGDPRHEQAPTDRRARLAFCQRAVARPGVLFLSAVRGERIELVSTDQLTGAMFEKLYLSLCELVRQHGPSEGSFFDSVFVENKRAGGRTFWRMGIGSAEMEAALQTLVMGCDEFYCVKNSNRNLYLSGFSHLTCSESKELKSRSNKNISRVLKFAAVCDRLDDALSAEVHRYCRQFPHGSKPSIAMANPDQLASAKLLSELGYAPLSRCATSENPLSDEPRALWLCDQTSSKRQNNNWSNFEGLEGGRRYR